MPVYDPIPFTDEHVLITKMIQVSPYIAEHYYARKYLMTLSPDEVNLNTIMQHLLVMLRTELENIGIFTPDDLMTNLDAILAAIDLRDAFDGDKLLAAVARLNVDDRTKLRDQLDDQPDLIGRVIEFFYIATQRTSWERMYQQRDTLFSTGAFLTHMENTIANAEHLPPPASVTDANVEEVAFFLNWLTGHRNNVKAGYDLLMKAMPELNQAYIQDEITTHDLDLLNPEHLSVVAAFYNLKVKKLKPVPPPPMVKHYTTAKHHVFDATPEMVRTSLACLLADEYEPGKSAAAYVEDVEKFNLAPEYKQIILGYIQYLVPEVLHA